MKIDIIIYSKDRALQLDLLLRSIKENFINAGNIFILYDYSSDSFSLGYNIIKARYPAVTFIKQDKNSFANILRHTVHKLVTTSYVLPLCDDDLFINAVDVTPFLQFIDTKTVGLSFRHSKNINISYHSGEFVPLPVFLDMPVSNLLKWNWGNQEISSSWGYPYMAGGMVYSTSFLATVLDSISFVLPNSLESAMIYSRYNWKKNFVCGLSDNPIINVSVNRVQNENTNRGGRDINYSVDELNSYLLDSKQIDLQNTIDVCKQHNNCEFIEIPLQIQDVP